MRDDAVEARLITARRNRSDWLRGSRRAGAARSRRTSRSPCCRRFPGDRADAPDNPARRHRAGHLDRRAGCRFQEDGRHRFADDIGNRARGARRDHAQFATKEAHHVQMVDQHLGNHHPLFVLRVRLAFEQRPATVGIGQQPGCDRRHAREKHVAQLARGNPSLELAIPRPEPPVLVRHEPRLARDPADERLATRPASASWASGTARRCRARRRLRPRRHASARGVATSSASMASAANIASASR